MIDLRVTSTKYVVEAPVRKIQHFSPLRVSDEFSFVYLAN